MPANAIFRIGVVPWHFDSDVLFVSGMLLRKHDPAGGRRNSENVNAEVFASNDRQFSVHATVFFRQEFEGE